VQFNGDRRLHCYGSNYCSTVKRIDVCDYGLRLEAQNSPNVTLRNIRVFVKLSYRDFLQGAANCTHRPPTQPLAVKGLNVFMVFGIRGYALRRCIITGVRYFLFLYLPYIKERCPMQLVSIFISYVYASFFKIRW